MKANASVLRPPLTHRVGRRFVGPLGTWALIALLLVVPVTFGLNDLVTTGSLERLANNVVAGISNGSIWALVAVGYTLVYGTIGLINFANGEVFMLGSLTCLSLFAALGLAATAATASIVGGVLLAVLAAAAVSGSLNVLIERVAFKPTRDEPKLATLIIAVGFVFILQNVGLLWIGGSPRAVPDLIGAQAIVLDAAGVKIARGDLFALGVAVPVLYGLYRLFTGTRAGRAMRATAQAPEAARLMGVDVDRTIAFTFLVTGVLAGVAGLVYALYHGTVWFQQGFAAGLIGFTAAVLGGMGNVKGAVVGGLVIGCIQQISDNRIGSQWTPVIVFTYLILIIVFKPSGLFGERLREGG